MSNYGWRQTFWLEKTCVSSQFACPLFQVWYRLIVFSCCSPMSLPCEECTEYQCTSQDTYAALRLAAARAHPPRHAAPATTFRLLLTLVGLCYLHRLLPFP